jgi:uncharacterized protein
LDSKGKQMGEAGNVLLSGTGFVLLALGLAGAVIPVLPGPLLIWLGAFLWAWGDGFARVGWGTLIVLAVLALAAWASDLFLTMVVSRRAGASWKAILGAIVGGILGGILLSEVLLLGTIVGAMLGAVLGMYAVEYLNTRNADTAIKAVRAYLFSMVLAAVVELSIALAMVGIFAWQAFG